MNNSLGSNKKILLSLLVFTSPFFIFCILMLFVGGMFTVNTEYEEQQKKNSIEYEGYGFACSPTGELDKTIFEQGFVGKGVLASHADSYIKYAEKYGIDPVLLAAISFHETANGTSNAVVNYNNTGGLMNPDGSGLYRFSSIEESLDVQARSIANRIKEIINRDGEYTLEALRDVYAPLGATNDPNNLNQYWLPRITEYATALGGFTMNCEAVYNATVDGASLPINPPLTVTSSYGYRVDPITGKKGAFHQGVDLAGSLNAPVYAIWDGVVIYSKYHYSWGNYIVILHPNGDTTLFAHMSELGLPVGTTVKAGQQVGKVGSTGSSTGPHLHIEFRQGNDATNIGTSQNTKDIYPILVQIQNNLSAKE